MANRSNLCSTIKGKNPAWQRALSNSGGWALVAQELCDEGGQLPRFLILESGVHDHQGSGVHVVVGGGDDEVGAVVVDKQLPDEAVRTDESVAKRRAVHAGNVAAGIGAAEVRFEGEILAQDLLEGSDNVVDRSVDSSDGGFGEVAVDL